MGHICFQDSHSLVHLWFQANHSLVHLWFQVIHSLDRSWLHADHSLGHAGVWFQADHILDHLWFPSWSWQDHIRNFVWLVWRHTMVRLWSAWSGNSGHPEDGFWKEKLREGRNEGRKNFTFTLHSPIKYDLARSSNFGFFRSILQSTSWYPKKSKVKKVTKGKTKHSGKKTRKWKSPYVDQSNDCFQFAFFLPITVDSPV